VALPTADCIRGGGTIAAPQPAPMVFGTTGRAWTHTINATTTTGHSNEHDDAHSSSERQTDESETQQHPLTHVFECVVSMPKTKQE